MCVSRVMWSSEGNLLLSTWIPRSDLRRSMSKRMVRSQLHAEVPLHEQCIVWSRERHVHMRTGVVWGELHGELPHWLFWDAVCLQVSVQCKWHGGRHMWSRDGRVQLSTWISRLQVRFTLYFVFYRFVEKVNHVGSYFISLFLWSNKCICCGGFGPVIFCLRKSLGSNPPPCLSSICVWCPGFHRIEHLGRFF